jgi:hypothetical protein
LEGIVQPPYPAIELDDQPFHQPDSLLAEQYQRINRKRALRGNPCSHLPSKPLGAPLLRIRKDAIPGKRRVRSWDEPADRKYRRQKNSGLCAVNALSAEVMPC